MRIGMVVVDLPDVTRVGSERRYSELIGRLRRDGHEIHLFAHRWGRRAASQLICHRLPLVGPSPLAPLTFALAALAGTRRWRDRVDLIHSHTTSLGEDIVSPGGGAHRAHLQALSRSGPRLRRWARPWHPRHRARIFVERLQFARARRIVLNSEWSRQTLATAYRSVDGRTEVVYNGVDTEFFSPAVCRALRVATRRRLGLGDGVVAFLFVGAGVLGKGLFELLEAFARLSRPAARLVVVGRRDARETGRVAASITRLGLGGRVILESFAPDPRPYYAAADVFVLPTKWDPFSNATAEALACGLPAITTASNGVSELMTDGLEGLVVADPGDVAALHRALEMAMHAEHRVMGEAARALAERLTWTRHVDAMCAIYDTMLREGR